MTSSFLLKKTCIVVTLAVLYNGSAFKIFDADPLLKNSPTINLTGDELEQVLNLDPGGEYTTMSFQYEHDQYIGQYGEKNKGERCYNDHVRCLTSILSASRPVCGITVTGDLTVGFGTLCDLYLDNCKRNSAYWVVVDSGSCNRAKNVHVYGYQKNIPPIKT